MKKKPTRRTQEEKQKILEEIRDLTENGKSVDQALKVVGLNRSQYYSWRRKRKKVNELQEVLTFPIESGKLVIVAGPVNDIVTVLERLSQLK